MTRRLSNRAALVLAGVVVLVVGGYFGFQALFVKVSRTVERPFTGPAAHNPYYVLQHYLEELGYQARTVRGWPQPLSSDVLVMWLSDEPWPEGLRRWLAEGGRVWTNFDPDAPYDRYEWDPTPWYDAGVGDAGVGEAGMAPVLDADDEQLAEDADREGDADEAGDAGVVATSRSASICGPNVTDCLWAGQFDYGAGCLTLVSSWDLTNEQVVKGETAARVERLLDCPSRPRRVVIVVSSGRPWFGQLLIEHAPRALIALSVLLLASLWRAGVYFGPRVTPRPTPRRRMVEHLVAVGNLATRVGIAPLVEAARRELRQRALRAVPQAPQLRDEQLVASLAARTELPEAALRLALFEAPDGSPQQTLQIARAMQALWRKT